MSKRARQVEGTKRWDREGGVVSKDRTSEPALRVPDRQLAGGHSNF